MGELARVMVGSSLGTKSKPIARRTWVARPKIGRSSGTGGSGARARTAQGHRPSPSWQKWLRARAAGPYVSRHGILARRPKSGSRRPEQIPIIEFFMPRSSEQGALKFEGGGGVQRTGAGCEVFGDGEGTSRTSRPGEPELEERLRRHRQGSEEYVHAEVEAAQSTAAGAKTAETTARRKLRQKLRRQMPQRRRLQRRRLFQRLAAEAKAAEAEAAATEARQRLEMQRRSRLR